MNQDKPVATTPLISGVLLALTQLAKIIDRMPFRKAVLMLAILMTTFGTVLGGLFFMQA